VQLFPAFRVSHVDDASAQPTEQVDALLAVGQSRVLDGEDGVIEDLIASIEILAVGAKVGSSLRFVPCEHS